MPPDRMCGASSTAMHKLPGTPREVLSADDTPYDARAAMAARAIPYGVLSGGFAKAQLLAAGCVAAASDLVELRTLMKAGLSASVRN